MILHFVRNSLMDTEKIVKVIFEVLKNAIASILDNS